MKAPRWRIELLWRVTAVKKLASATDPLWYKDAIIYELHVRAFADSNGDGIGDFPGLLSQARLSAGSGRHLPLAAAVLPFAAARRRLRHCELLGRESVVRNAERLQSLSGCGARAQHAGDDRTGHQSHHRPASLVQGGAPGAARLAERDMYVWCDTDQKIQRRAHHLHGHGEIQLDLGRRRPRPTTGIGSSRTSPT